MEDFLPPSLLLSWCQLNVAMLHLAVEWGLDGDLSMTPEVQCLLAMA